MNGQLGLVVAVDYTRLGFRPAAWQVASSTAVRPAKSIMNGTHTGPATAETASNPLLSRAVDPFLEMGAYEYLWERYGAWSRLEKFLCAEPHEKVSELVDENHALQYAKRADHELRKAGIQWFDVRTRTEAEYGDELRKATKAVPCLYFQGYWNFTEMPSVAVIGTRRPTEDGRRRARKLTRYLVRDQYAIVSGLARGIDTVAHETALAEGGVTIAVMGTPLQLQYPAKNRALRDELAAHHLVVTQFPVGSETRPHFFPERNRMMSAISDATVIVEASETSGTRTQAKAALEQGRPLFIMDSCFRRGLSWPEKFKDQGAIRVHDYDDIKQLLPERP